LDKYPNRRVIQVVKLIAAQFPGIQHRDYLRVMPLLLVRQALGIALTDNRLRQVGQADFHAVSRRHCAELRQPQADIQYYPILSGIKAEVKTALKFVPLTKPIAALKPNRYCLAAAPHRLTPGTVKHHSVSACTRQCAVGILKLLVGGG
jgi:hypothetical protein